MSASVCHPGDWYVERLGMAPSGEQLTSPPLARIVAEKAAAGPDDQQVRAEAKFSSDLRRCRSKHASRSSIW
jgi:hypothetical protein